MHDFHAWISLAQSPFEDDDDLFAQGVEEVRSYLAGADFHTSVFELKTFNGATVVLANGLVNRIRVESEFLDGLLALVARVLPGSHGLVYDRADELPGPNSFRVRVLARGVLTERGDPFLSPCNPVIED